MLCLSSGRQPGNTVGLLIFSRRILTNAFGSSSGGQSWRFNPRSTPMKRLVPWTSDKTSSLVSPQNILAGWSVYTISLLKGRRSQPDSTPEIPPKGSWSLHIAARLAGLSKPDTRLSLSGQCSERGHTRSNPCSQGQAYLVAGVCYGPTLL